MFNVQYFSTVTTFPIDILVRTVCHQLAQPPPATSTVNMFDFDLIVYAHNRQILNR